MRVLITGGAGFIGSHLADYHLSRNNQVTVVDNLSTGTLNNLKHHLKNPLFTFYNENIASWPGLSSALSDCDLVYHMAAVLGMFNVIEHPIDTLHMNIDATRRLLSLAAKQDNQPTVLIASSSEVYGSKSGAMNELDPLILDATNKAHSSYPISKLANENDAFLYHKKFNLPIIVIRLFNTVGPRQLSKYGMVIPRFIEQAANNNPLTIFGDGKQTRSFCDVRDICEIFYRLSQTQNSLGEIINVGHETAISIIELAKLTKTITHSNSSYEFLDTEEIFHHDYLNIKHRKPDLNKLFKLIDYQYQWTLKTTINDMLTHLKI